MISPRLLSALLVSLVLACGASDRPPVDPAIARSPLEGAADVDPTCTPYEMRCRDKTTIQVCSTAGGVQSWNFLTNCPMGCGKVGAGISCCETCTVGERKKCDKITRVCDECVTTQPGCTFWLRR